MAAQVQAQVVSLSGLSGNEPNQEEEVSSDEFQRSLNDVIAMLDNEEQRTALLNSLRELQVTTDATQEEGIVRQGLLGALADTLTDLGEQAQQATHRLMSGHGNWSGR